MDRPDTQVVVVGAGPVGMTAAALLAARGVAVTVFERNTSTSDEPKAISLDDEALRVYQAAGLADRILRVLVPGTGTRYYDSSGAAVFQARSPQPFRFGYPFKNPFAQPDLERELFAHLSDRPLVTLRMGTEVLDVRPGAEHVEVTYRPAGAPDSAGETIRARYVLGCDGGRSVVRRALGIDMSGRSYPEPWLVVDVLGDHHDERYGMHHADPSRPHVIIPGLRGRCRYEFLLHPGEGAPETGADFPLIRRLLEPFRSITPEQVERAVIYRFHALVADRWQQGRVFLLGDAAHMMPPFAGQGLNSGIRDVANLCWKLAEVLDGRLAPAALDSYETERRPHAEATVRLSERLRRIVMSTDERFARRRDAYLATALRDPGTRTFYEEMRYRPPHGYQAGLLAPAEDPAAGPIGAMIGQPRAFDSATGRTVLLDEFTGTGWALFGVGVPPQELTAAADLLAELGAKAALIPVDDRMPRDGARCLVDVDGQLDAEFARYRGQLLLVRPDHFVAAVWAPGRAPALGALHLATFDDRQPAVSGTGDRKEIHRMSRPDRKPLAQPEAAGALRRTATSHIGLRVPEVGQAAEFYGRILGLHVQSELDDGGLRLGWGSGHHVLDLTPGEPGLDHIGFEVRDPGGMADLEKRFRDAGHDVAELDQSYLDCPSDGKPVKGLAVTDPDGNTVHFHGPVRREGEHSADTARRPVRYQHVTLSTSDVPAMVAFYTGVAGFRLSDQLADGSFAWMRSDRDHHSLAVVETGRTGGIDHYSFDLAEWEDFKAWCDRLTDEGVDVTWGPGRHGPGNNLFIFFDDPAGNHVELSAEMEKFHDDRVAYEPRKWEPVPVSVNLWGGQLATWRKTSEGNG
jgi:3-(3-hydroxy-phenyl)propionate hydroxylase